MQSARKLSQGALLAILLLTGCAGPSIGYLQLQVLSKGMGSAEVSAALKQGPLEKTEVRSGGRTFSFQRYFMTSSVATDPYFLAYENDKLGYWGTVSEFRRHPDTVLTDAFNQAFAILSVPKK